MSSEEEVSEELWVLMQRAETCEDCPEPWNCDGADACQRLKATKFNLFGKDSTYLGYAQRTHKGWSLFFPDGSLAVRDLARNITVKAATRWLIAAKTQIYAH